MIDLRRRNDADSRKQGGVGGSVLKYVTDGDNAADNEDAHSIERKYAMRLYGFIGCSIFNHGFCISLVSAFCHGLVRPIDLIINFGDKIAVNPEGIRKSE